jgi:hypothetical protein
MDPESAGGRARRPALPGLLPGDARFRERLVRPGRRGPRGHEKMVERHPRLRRDKAGKQAKDPRRCGVAGRFRKRRGAGDGDPLGTIRYRFPPSRRASDDGARRRPRVRLGEGFRRRDQDRGDRRVARGGNAGPLRRGEGDRRHAALGGQPGRPSPRSTRSRHCDRPAPRFRTRFAGSRSAPPRRDARSTRFLSRSSTATGKKPRRKRPRRFLVAIGERARSQRRPLVCSRHPCHPSLPGERANLLDRAA